MNEELLIFLVVLLVVAVVTVVGHGIWMMLAWIIRAISGVSAEERARRETFQNIHRLYTSGRLDHESTDRVLRALRGEILPPRTQAQPRPAEAPALPPPLPVPVMAVTPAQPMTPVLPPLAKAERAVRPPPAQVQPVAKHVIEPAALSHPTTPAPRPVPVEPAKPKPPFSELFLRFMEESNIRWGELIGGALFLGCLIALLITFRQEIAQLPLLRFLVLTGSTAAVFGAGLYTEHRWRLPTTSRGILLIAVLMSPCSYLAMTLSSSATTSPWPMLGEAAALCVLGVLTWLSAQVLMARWPAALTLGVIGPMLCQSVITRVASPGTAPLLVLGAAVLACFAAACALGLRGIRRAWTENDARLPMRLLMLTGIAGASAALALGMLIHGASDALAALRQLAPLSALAALPCMAVGQELTRRLTERQGEDGASGIQRTWASALAMLGAALLLAGMALAWPCVPGLAAAALAAFAALTFIAVVHDMPAAHLLGLPCLALAYLAIAVTYPAGLRDPSSAQFAQALLSSRAGPALLPFCAALLLAIGMLWRMGRQRHLRPIALVATMVAAASIALVSVHGLGRAVDHGAPLVYAAFAVTALACACLARRDDLTWAGALLLLLALLQGLVFHGQGPKLEPVRLAAALLAHASAMTALRWLPRLGRPVLISSIVTSAAAALAILWPLVDPSAALHWPQLALLALWLAGLWLILSLHQANTALFAAMQFALALAACLGVCALLSRAGYAPTGHRLLLDPLALQWQGLAVVMLSMLFTALRLAMRSRSEGLARTLLEPAWPAADQVLRNVVLALGVTLAALALMPGIARELHAPAANAPLATPAEAGPVGMALLVAVLLSMLLGQWERFRFSQCSAMLVALAALLAMFAARFDVQRSAASAARHLAALLLLAGATPLLLRRQSSALVRRMRWPETPESLGEPTAAYQSLLLALTLAPILLITCLAAGKQLFADGMGGPLPDSLFGHMGASANYLLPLGLSFAVLVALALRQRSQTLAFGAALLLHLTVTLAYALWLSTHRRPLDAAALLMLGQLNALAGGVYALAWARLHAWHRRDETSGEPVAPLLLQVLTGLNALLLLALLLPAEMLVLINPAQSHLLAQSLAWPANFAAWAAVGGATLWLACLRERRFPAWATVAATWVVGSLAAFAVGASQPLLALNCLLVARVLGALALMALDIPAALRRMASADDAPQTRLELVPAGVLLLALALGVSIRLYGVPEGQAWGIVGVAAVGLSAIALAFLTMHSAWLHATGGLATLAAALWWFMPMPLRPGDEVAGLLQVVSLALAGSGLGLLWIELRLLRPLRQQAVERGPIAWHRLAAILALVLTAIYVPYLLLRDSVGATTVTSHWLLWTPPGLLLLLVLGTLYDPDARRTMPALHLATLLAAALVVHFAHPPFEQLLRIAGPVLAVHALAAAWLCTQRAALVNLATRAGVPARADWLAGLPMWLVGAVLAQLIGTFALSTPLVMHHAELPARFLAAVSTLLAVTALGLLTQRSAAPPAPVGRLHHLTLILGVPALCLWGWSLLPPAYSTVALDRLVIVMGVVALAAAVCGSGLARFLPETNDWTRAARTVAPWFAGTAALLLLGTLGTEVAMYRPAGAPISLPAALIAAGAILALAGACVVIALVPGRDPLSLSDRGRTVYVYVAEVLLVLLAVHLRVVFPWIFAMGFWSRYWPIILLVLAYTCVGLAELFRQRGRHVLAEPMENTAALLPALPILAWWLLIRHWEHAQQLNYALVLLLAAGSWAALALQRRSFLFASLAILAANGSLWYVLQHTEGLRFAQHPQLWLIPLASCILVAAQFNRDRLDASSLRGLRYACLMVIYLSSTADFFLNDSVAWLPLVLAALAVGGVVLGIAVRVQSFLYLGSGFLLVAILGMIRLAAITVGRNWPWLVAGLVLGAAMIVLFALFEKKREEMRSIFDQLRQWEG